MPDPSENEPPMASNAPPAPAPTSALKTPPAGASADGVWLVERPEPGLERGHYAWPDWAVLAFGGVFVLLGLGYVFVKLRHVFRK